MKNTKRILSFLFFSVFGVMLAGIAGFLPIVGMLMGFISYLPLNFPTGILGNGAIDGDDEKEKEFLEKITKSFNKLITEKNRGFITEEGLELKLKSLEDQLKTFSEGDVVNKKAVADLTKAFDELAKVVKSNEEGAIVSKTVSKQEFKKSLEEAIKLLKKNRSGFVNVEKTVGTMSITASTDGQIPQADRESGVTNVIRQRFTIRDASNTSGITSNLAEWVEQQNIEGGADMTAEGASKSQMDWEYKVNNAAVKKITDFVKITTEMLDDVDGMMAEINGNLTYQVELKEESQLITGDGTDQNLNGIEKYAQPLDLAALSGTVANPNRADVIGAAITQIRENGKGELEANRVFMRPSDIFLMIHAAKSTTAEYVNPITMVPNVNNTGIPNIFIWGVPVVASDSITAGEFIVADMTKFTVRDRQQMSIEIGYENDDFTKNLVTIRGEKRLVSYAKTNHVEAFVTDTFADGIVFLTPAS